MPSANISAKLINASDIRDDYYILSMLVSNKITLIDDWILVRDGGLLVIKKENQDIRIVLGNNSLLFTIVDSDDALEAASYAHWDLCPTVVISDGGAWSGVVNVNNPKKSGKQVFEIYTAYMAPIMAVAMRCISYR